MANRDTNLNINVTATDRATPALERIEKKIDGLESDEARIVVTAETDRLERQLSNAKSKLDGLTGDEATVQARLIGRLEADLEAAQTLFRQLDGKTGTVRLNAVDKASDDIDKVGDKLRQLDGDTATVRVDAGGSGSLGAGAAVGAAGLAAGLGLAAQNAADTAIQVQAIANRTGASLEDVSRLVAVFKDNGVEASDLADILYNVNGVLRDNPELAEQLGVKIDGSTDMVENFLTAVEGLETGFDDVGAAGVAASQLLGEEGVRQVDYVIASVGDLRTEVENVGSARVYTAEDVEAGRQVNTQLAETKGHIEEIAIALLPIINAGLGGLAEFVTKSIEDPFGWGSAVNTALLANPITAPTAAFLAASGQDSDVSGVIARNTTGFYGGAYGGVDTTDLSTAPRGRASVGGNVTIINSYGSAADTVAATRAYERRNGTPNPLLS